MQHRPPGKQTQHKHVLSASEIAAKKKKYLDLAYATSYAMQAKSEFDSAESWIEKLKDGSGAKPRRVQSILGGAFLRMYLDGKTNPDQIAAAGKEIGESPEFKALCEELNKYLQGKVSLLDLSRMQEENLRRLADEHLKAIKAKRGIAFRYTLNAVIGGVTGVTVKSVNHLEDKTTPSGYIRKYRVDINFSDTYDFENKRYGEYDHYRKQLARYLIANDFE
jgi:hypothetical protein